ncbi:primosomal protein N' (replication factor Y) - superfamily II helicase [Thioclava sp. SK-1]|uniref:zinc ribbon domain-containing protein n=1 Tax=Thioclava sp. SK-1 TaxID=1889770 RepID=UPI000824CCAE|nr:zinc ribbon domain-containing protein [Thioclava sp. SK-1]OCX66709.1 primosomal protein N' (replication factor Y) - superfamily II helicase [Thioclava sp. SK-1]
MQLPKVPRKRVAVAHTDHHYPCDACGGDLRFAPGQTRLVCDHCGHVQDIPAATHRGAAQLQELPLAQGLAQPSPEAPTQATADGHSLTCPNCAASIELAPNEHATQCPFCATPVVIDTGTQRALKPQGVIPFMIDENAAREALALWLKTRWFAPNGLAQFARKGRRMTGVYAPFWTFDAQSQTRYVGQRGDYYYETRRVGRGDSSRTERVRKTRWSHVTGRVSRMFDDVLIYASRSLPPDHITRLQPWDLAALKPYRSDYLSGFSAESYTVELPEGHTLARAEMLRVIQSDVRRDIGGDTQRIAQIDPHFAAETFKHVLLPLWTAAYKFRGQSYRFIINAQTGQVSGDRPWSAWKIALAIGAAAVIGALIFYVSR